jgi:hypothetical protein
MQREGVIDEYLFAYVTSQWRKMNFVAGHALIAIHDAGLGPIDDMTLLRRLSALVGEGRIEAQGDPSRHAYCEVRLPGRE